MPGPWVGEQEPAVGGATDARADDALRGIGAVEGHVRFLVVLAVPGLHVRELLFLAAILVEDDHDGADVAWRASQFAHHDLALVPVADRLLDVDAVEHRGGEGHRSRLILGEHALSAVTQVASEVLDQQVLGRVGTDRLGVEALEPLAGVTLVATFASEKRTPVGPFGPSHPAVQA